MATAPAFVPPQLPTYPASYPLADRAPYGIAAQMGLVRTEMTGGNVKQRRIFRHMPQTFALQFHMHTDELYSWQYWVNTYAYDWFYIPLASLFAPPANWSPDGVQPAGLISPHMARFISDLAITLDGHDWWAVTVAAEVSPLMFAGLKPPPGLNIIDGGTADNPSPITDILDGRTADAPAPGGPVDGGTAETPS